MKILSTLLLLVAVLGGAWWKLTYPDAGVEEARAQGAAALERVRNVVAAARDGALQALAGPGGAASGSAAEWRLAALERRLDELDARFDALDASRERSDEALPAPVPSPEE